MKFVEVDKHRKEPILAILILGCVMGIFAFRMGLSNMFKTLMSTAHDLLLNTCFYIMGVSVLAGGLSGLLSEFGVVNFINKPIEKVTKPLYDLPGVASLGILTTYLSDNPAIITLAENKSFVKYFKKYQLPAITNLGTAFGMGLIVSTYMMALSPKGNSFLPAILVGNIGAVFGSVVSVRLMLRQTKKIFGTEECVQVSEMGTGSFDMEKIRTIRDGNVMQRFIEALLDGGKVGVTLGLDIIPGVVIITTAVLLLTNGAGPDGEFTGALGEGIGVLPLLGEKLNFLIKPLLGFSNPESIAFPITALGSVGAALGTVPSLMSKGIIQPHDIAVFTAMGMCWSGYLSTHIAMMDALNLRKLTNKAIISHTVGGLCAGIFANYLYQLVDLFI
ncbi:MAG: hypothetical protein Q4G61_10495 [Tissierellia bacterium]|nr:hypothetical protein [Tissierellia bacterium]